MADCFSAPNAAELVEQMRLCADEKIVHCKECKFVGKVNDMCMNIMVNCAADAIEQLLSKIGQDDAEYCALSCALTELDEKYDALEKENAKLKAERDAAVEDLRSLDHKYSFSMCNCCKNKGSNKCISCHDDPLTLPEYEWRGVQDA